MKRYLVIDDDITDCEDNIDENNLNPQIIKWVSIS